MRITLDKEALPVHPWANVPWHQVDGQTFEVIINDYRQLYVVDGVTDIVGASQRMLDCREVM